MFIKIIRWLTFLPLSFLGGAAVFIIYDFFGSRYIEPGSIGDFIQSLLGGALSGAAATYIAIYIAPCCVKKVTIGYVLLALTAILLSAPYMIYDELSKILFYASQNIGLFYMAYLIYKGSVTFDNKNG